MVRTSQSPRSKPRTVALFVFIAWTCAAAQIESPGKLTSVYSEGSISFHYPQNWQILKQKGPDDILIGPPGADPVASWQEWEQVETKKNRKESKLVLHTMVSHGLLFGWYEPNFPSPQGAADELLGRFHQYYPSLSYVGSDQEKRANGLPALVRALKISETKPPLPFPGLDESWQRVLDANGFLFLIKDGPRVWYWLSFAPAWDSQQYQPTLAAILASIAINGSPLDLEEDATPSGPPEQSHSVQELSPEEIAKISLKSVVLLATQDSRGRALKLGSGFFVRDGVIATNFHVIEGAQLANASVVGDSQLFRVLGTVAVDKQRDLALLAVNGPKIPSLQLDDPPSPVDVGDTVYVAGNPEGLEGTFSQGIVSGVRQQGQSALIQITAPISPGSSGGPVLNQKGRVIGVAVATFKEGQNLNFAVPVIQLSELILKVGPTIPLAGASRMRCQAPSR